MVMSMGLREVESMNRSSAHEFEPRKCKLATCLPKVQWLESVASSAQAEAYESVFISKEMSLSLKFLLSLGRIATSLR